MAIYHIRILMIRINMMNDVDERNDSKGGQGEEEDEKEREKVLVVVIVVVVVVVIMVARLD